MIRPHTKLAAVKARLGLSATIVIVSLALLLGAFLAPVPQAQATDKSALGSTPTISIVGVEPAVLTDEKEITVRVNLSDLDSSFPARVLLFMQADPLKSVAQVEEYVAGEGASGWAASELVLNEQQRAQAQSRSGTILELKVPVEDLPLWNPLAWGSYGFEVRLVNAGEASPAEVPRDHSLLIWYPPDSDGDLAVNLLLPSSMSAEAVGAAKDEKNTGLTLALTPEEATALAESGEGKQKVEAVLLPVQNADLSMLASVEQDDLYQLAVDSQREALPSDVEKHFTVVEDVVVGSLGWMSSRFLTLAQGNTILGPTATLQSAGSGLVQVMEPIDTRPAKTRVVTAGGISATVIESWQTMSRFLSSTSTSVSEFNLLQEIRAVSVLAAADWAASSADDDGPAYPLHLWVRVPSTLAPSLLKSRLDAVLDVPWVTPTSLQQIIDSDDVFTVLDPVEEATAVDIAAISDLMKRLGDLVERGLALAAASSEDFEVFADELPSLLYPTAADLTLDERTHRVNEVLPQLEEAFNVIGVAPTRTVNVMNSNADFPVTLSNRSAHPVEIEVGLETADPRLQAKEWAHVTVPAFGTTIAQVPVVAVGSGDVSVLVVAKTADGTILDASQEVDVRVRAGLEDTLLWTMGGIAFVLFVLGLIRTLRKGRRRGTRVKVGND